MMSKEYGKPCTGNNFRDNRGHCRAAEAEFGNQEKIQDYIDYRPGAGQKHQLFFQIASDQVGAFTNIKAIAQIRIFSALTPGRYDSG